MLTFAWLRGLPARRGGRLVAVSGGVAVAVALLASIGLFLATSKATMTQRSITRVGVDWQVQAAAGADPRQVLATVAQQSGVRAALEVDFGRTSGLSATSAGTTQTTGAGVVVGLPDGYRQRFSDQLRDLAGGGTGVLLAQQTAANLHAGPGDSVTVGRQGLPPLTVRIDGVVDLPQADSLFQQVGAPVGTSPQAPPDNVLLLPAGQFTEAFGPLEQTRPDLVTHQVHVALDRRLPADPAAAYTAAAGRARNTEVKLAGTGLVGDNLGAALGAARKDALYAQVLFVFLGLPGAILAGLLTAAVASTGAVRRRREQALLRTRGASTRQLVRLAGGEALVVGLVGSVAGLLAAAAVGRLAFGSAGFGATGGTAAAGAALGAGVGMAIAWLTLAVPARRDARQGNVADARLVVGRVRSPRWQRYGLDAILLAAAEVVFSITSKAGYSLVLAPEGISSLSVDYWAFAGPVLLWAGTGLLAWRLSDLLLRRGRRPLAALLRPVAGPLATTVTAALSRQRALLNRAVVLLVLTVGFAASTATFNSTYAQQAHVDALLSNGADVTVTQSPGTVAGPDALRSLATMPGVRHVEPVQHRFAYVGADLQDLYGVRPGTIVGATQLQNGYFQGGTARELIGRLGAQLDGILVSSETVKDFQLQPGDPITLRLQEGRTKALKAVGFHYLGVAKEFPTAPSDSFLLANADYIAQQTGSAAVGAFLVDTGGKNSTAIAARLSTRLGTSAKVTDVVTSRTVIGSSLTAVDLAGLTRVELGFAFLLVAGSSGLVLALGLAERRRTLAIAYSLGARARQLGAFVWSETGYVLVVGAVLGIAGATVLTTMLVTVLTGVFDPPPDVLSIPWAYLGTVVAVAVAAAAAAALSAAAQGRRDPLRTLRDL